MDFQSHDGLRKLLSLFRQNSQKLMEKDLGGMPVAVEDCERQTLAFHQQLSLMLVNHAAFTARYTMHFMLKDAVAVLARKRATEPAALSKEQAIDYCKEFCNVLVGSIVNGLVAQELFTVHSLPFSMQGYNDIFFAGYEGDGLSDAYYLRSELGRIGISLDLSIWDADGIGALAGVDVARIVDASFSGGFDFL